MSVLGDVPVTVSVVLGSTSLPIRQIVKMGRGAMIPLDGGYAELSELHVNGVVVALGRIRINGDRMALEISDMLGTAR
jgi:flagellar motor switch protein FliN